MDIETIREYAMSKKGTTESFPFGDETLVFKVGGKIFLLMGMMGNPPSCSMKCDPDKAVELREQYSEITGAYHLNKKHWNGVRAGGAVSWTLLKELIDHSYELVAKTKNRKKS